MVAFYSYVQGYLGMCWRKWMTGEFLKNYFNNRNYYEIEAGKEIDNPDQRIMEDIRSFTRTSLAFLLILLGSVMDLVSFTRHPVVQVGAAGGCGCWAIQWREPYSPPCSAAGW